MKSVNYLVAIAFLLATSALAQGDAGNEETTTMPAEMGGITGVVNAVIDGEPLTVHTFQVEAGQPELTNTAYWEDWRDLGIGISVDVSAHTEARVGISAWEDAFSFDLDLSDDLEYRDYGGVPDMTYFESLRNPYRMSEGSLELTEAAFVDDETLRLSGSFEGTFSSPLGEGDKEISGTFEFYWVSMQRLDF